jgi:hypothetical protein
MKTTIMGLLAILALPLNALAWPTASAPPAASALESRVLPLFFCFEDDGPDCKTPTHALTCAEDMTVAVNDCVFFGVSIDVHGLVGPFPSQLHVTENGIRRIYPVNAVNGLIGPVNVNVEGLHTLQGAAPGYRPAAQRVVAK